MTPPDVGGSSAPAMSAGEFGEVGAEAIRLLCGDQRRVDVSAIRRTLADVVLAWPGEVGERWWKWFVEASRGLSYPARVVDASSDEVFELLRHGATAVTLSDAEAAGEPRLLVLTGTRRKKFRLCELPEKPVGRWVSQRELTGLLGGAKSTTARRWVVLEPRSDDLPSAAAADGHGGGSGHPDHAADDPPTPWSRLWLFLRPERLDIGTVLVFALFAGLLALATPIAVQTLVNTVAFGVLLQPLIVLSIILLTFLSFAAALTFLERVVVELVQRRLFARVVARLAWQLPRVRLTVAHKFTPELINRFFDIVTVQKIVAQLLLDGLGVVLTVGLGMTVLGFYHPWLLAFDVLLLLLLFVNVFVLGRGAVRTSIVESKCKYAVAGWLEQIARCATTFKTGGAAELALERADRLTADYLLARQAHFRVLVRQILGGLALQVLASVVLLVLGGLLVIQRQMTLGQLVAAELIVTLIVASVAKFDKHLEGFYDLLTSMDKLGHLFDLPVEGSSGVMDVGRSGAASLSLRQVSFAPQAGPDLLAGVTFDVLPGEVVAVTGSAGCGKSTLLDLVFRLYDPRDGHLTLDGLDLRDLRPDALRQQIALARSIEVLDGSLAENVHLGRLEITIADVREGLRRVGLEDSTKSLPNGLDTVLFTDGRPLSKSQARRLMLARALVGRPRLLLIDGLLDALSDEDAERLLEELQTSRSTCTVLIATVRKSLALKCDRIWNLSP